MRLKSVISYIIFYTFFITSCSTGSNKTEVQAKFPIKEIKVTPPLKQEVERFCEFEQIHLVPLETNEESILGSHNKIKVCKGRIFVLDTHNAQGLFVFDMEGKYLFKIAQKGNGPGEFSLAGDFFVDTVKNTIAIFDANKKNIHYYDWTGKYVQTRTMREKWPHSCYPLNLQTLALAYISYDNGSNPFELKLLDENNNDFYNFMPLRVNYTFPNNGSISFYDGIDAVYYTPVLCDTFFVVNTIGIERGYYINFGNYAVPSNFFEGVPQVVSAYSRKLMNSQYCYMIYNIAETPDLLHFQYNYSDTGRFAIYNKKTGKVIYNSMLYVYYPGIEASYGNYMIGIQNPFYIVESISQAEQWKDVIGEKNFEILKNIKDTDNPVVYFYKLKI